MKNGTISDNTYVFFKEAIEVLNSHKGPLTKDTILKSFLLAANNQSPLTQRRIGNYLKHRPEAFLTECEKKYVSDNPLTINEKLTTKASAIAMAYAMGKIALTIVISYILPYIAFSAEFTLSMKLIIIPTAAICAFIIKGYLERSEKESMELLYNTVDKKWAMLSTNLECFSALAYKLTTQVALNTTAKPPQTMSTPKKSENILINFNKKRPDPEPSTRELRSRVKKRIQPA
jgi:hypothetical protein